MKQIVTHFTDNDLYTFTCQYYILETYPNAEVRYSFFDRNKRKYPEGFAKMLQEQIDGMANVTITNEEIAFMRRKCYFLPEWYFIFLRGYRFNPAEVHITQDEEGHLDITIEGKWYSTIMWEMPILSTISELMNHIEGNMDGYDRNREYKKSFDKMCRALEGGLTIGDMGTRRRFSFDHHDMVIGSFVDAVEYTSNNLNCTGKFIGSSNVYLAMKYDIGIVGTMSHQLISFEENISGLNECNFNVMKKFSDVYDGDNGIYLYDCFGDKVFFNNISKRMAMMYNGLRVDSGDEREQLEKIINMYKRLGIDPRSKSIVFSNALTIDKALNLHKITAGRMKDSYGLGTHLCADVVNVGYSNIVIKLTGMRVDGNHAWHTCVKLSCDTGKVLGDGEKCKYLLSQINNL